MSLADEIRAFAFLMVIEPARRRGDGIVTVRAGDIRSAMRLQSRMPAVYSALGGRLMEDAYGVKLVRRSGPAQGANVFFAFSIGDALRESTHRRPRVPTPAAVVPRLDPPKST